MYTCMKAAVVVSLLQTAAALAAQGRRQMEIKVRPLTQQAAATNGPVTATKRTGTSAMHGSWRLGLLHLRISTGVDSLVILLDIDLLRMLFEHSRGVMSANAGPGMWAQVPGVCQLAAAGDPEGACSAGHAHLAGVLLHAPSLDSLVSITAMHVAAPPAPSTATAMLPFCQVGVGTSTLQLDMVQDGYSRIVSTDTSAIAVRACHG
jgi:hypothetical protein